VEDFWKPLLST